MNGFERDKRETLELALAAISEKGGTCADPKLGLSGDELPVSCRKGHDWMVSPRKILEGDWCPICTDESAARLKRQETFQRFESYIHEQGGQVEASSYDFGGQKLSVVCARGHQRLADPLDVLYRKTARRECQDAEQTTRAELKLAVTQAVIETTDGNRRDTIRQVAVTDGGTVISEHEVGGRHFTCVRCEKHGIESLVRNDRIASGQWCKDCGIEKRSASRRLKTFLRAQVHAEKMGGRMVSESFESGASTLEWECSHGHRWHAAPSAVLNRGTWCPRDALTSPTTMTVAERHRRAVASRLARCLEVAKQSAAARGGECLSTAYLRSADGLKFRCSRGHEFQMRFNLLKKHWCPECARTRTSYGEILVRAVLEQLIGARLPTVRPAWLRSSKNRGLSLDMLNESLALAFEYQGDGVHSGFRRSGWYNDPQKFERTLEIDREKIEACRKHGVRLIPIPGYKNYVSTPDVVEQVKQLLRENAIRFDETKVVDIDHDGLFLDDLFGRVTEAVSSRGGQLISTVVPGMLHRIEVRCRAHDHTWLTTANALINQDKWCAVCAKERRSGSRTSGI